MPKTSSFNSLDKELFLAWRLFVRNWKPAVVISLLPAIPLFFLLPLLIEMNTVVVEEYFVRSADISAASIYTATLAVIATFIAWMYVRCCLFVLFSRGDGGRKALKEGLRRFPSFLWTEVFILVIVFGLSIPAIMFWMWALEIGWGELISQVGFTNANFFTYTTFGALVAPAVIVSMWFLFGPIGVAVGKTRGGMRALRHSISLVQGRWWSIFFRMVSLTAIVFVTRVILSPIPLASWIASFVLSIVLATFLVILHREALKR